ncbi:MAG: FlgD immunoglobulin-like domain containing protein [Candidatus Eisenbacteria bacterium]|nr:FlgD immunoglobulin-like domain containing protein [Candidatus Eisenbacteria bacterium]
MSSKIVMRGLLLGALFAALAVSVPAAEPWPYQPFDETHGLGNHFGEFQNYGGAPYYHDGIDLVTPTGPVQTFSVSDGTLTHITYNQPMYSGLMIGPPVSGGEGWLYWHINATTMQFDIGDLVQTNDYIGTTANWPVAQFHHCHFNRVRGTGGYPWGWYEAIDNPLLFMEPNTDPDAPVFEIAYNGKVFAFVNNGTTTIQDPTALTGSVDIVARIKDIVGMPQWALNAWKIDYWIDGATQDVPVTNSVTFSGHIPPDGTVGVIYSLNAPLRTFGDYDARIFYMIVTNTDGDGFVESSDANASWQTANFAAGDYWVYVRAADIGGNVVTDSMMVTVAGPVLPEINLPEASHDYGQVPTDQEVVWPLRIQNLGTSWLSIREVVPTNEFFRVDRSHFWVAPQGEEIVNVTFAPDREQLYFGGVRVRSNDADEGEIVVSLRGEGVAPAAAPDAGAQAGFGIRGIRMAGRTGLEVLFALDQAGDASLEIYDVAGRRVRALPLRGLAAGAGSALWDGLDAAGRTMPSAVYFVRLQAGGKEAKASAVLLR